LKKSILAATVIGAFLTGCSPFAFNTKGYAYKEEDLASAWAKVASHKYIYDVGEYWSSPVEFDARGGGDCEDFAFALVYRLGRDARSVCVRKPDGEFHEIVEFNDRYLEPQRFGMYYEKKDLTIVWVMDYDETMSVSTLWGVKSLRTVSQDSSPPDTTPPTQARQHEKDSCVAALSGSFNLGGGM